MTPQVGIVVVRAMPNALQAVRTYLERAQLMLRRQVILEAKVIEVTLKSGFEAGIQWNTFGKDSGGSFKPIIDADGNVIAAGSNNDVAGQFDFNQAKQFFNPLDSQVQPVHVVFRLRSGDPLLETQGAVQVLSSPRISTVNNQKAVIKVGSDEYFVTNISTTTVTAGSAINTNDSPQLTPFFSGIALDVTPRDQRRRRGDPAHPSDRQRSHPAEQDHRRTERAARGQHHPRIRQHRARAERPDHRDRRPDADHQR